MRLATICDTHGDVRLVAEFKTDDGPVLLDLARAYAAALRDEALEPNPNGLAALRIPADMRLFLDGGAPSLAAADAAMAWAARTSRDAPTRTTWLQKGLAHELALVEFLPPVLRPGKIISVGANYRVHLDEFKEDNVGEAARTVGAQMKAAKTPPAFAKLPSCMVGHLQSIVYPRWTKQFDYEAELCVVIGKRCKNVSAERYLDYVAGFTIMNDVSLRDIQMDEMKRGLLLMGKNLDTTAPTGPYLVTKDEIPNPQALQITTWVNGERRQHESTSKMIFSIAEIVAYYSRMTLEPGDIITTGSPGGVGIVQSPPERYLLKPGDLIEIEIEHLGQLRNRVIDEPVM